MWASITLASDHFVSVLQLYTVINICGQVICVWKFTATVCQPLFELCI